MRIRFFRKKILILFLSLLNFLCVPEVNLVFASGTDMSSERLSDEHEDKIDEVDVEQDDVNIDDMENRDNVGGRSVVSGDPDNDLIDDNEIVEEHHSESDDKSRQLDDQDAIDRDQVEQPEEQLDEKNVANTKPKDVSKDVKKGSRKPSEPAKRSRESGNKDSNKEEYNNLKTDNDLVASPTGMNDSVGKKDGELFASLSRVDANFAHHFDILEKVDFPIQLDCVIPLCTSSRPFLFARTFGFEPLLTPLDLVEKCSLKEMIRFFESGFSDFFTDVKKARRRRNSEVFWIRDLRNKLWSSLSFVKEANFDLTKRWVDDVRKFYLDRMRDGIDASSSVGLICDGHYPSRSLINFVRRFGRIYPDKTIVLINIDVVRGIEGALHISSPFASDKLKVVQFIIPERNVNKWQDVAYCIDAGQEIELKK